MVPHAGWRVGVVQSGQQPVAQGATGAGAGSSGAVFRGPAALVFAAGLAAPALLLVRPDFVEPVAAWLFVASVWAGLVIAYLYLRDPLRPPLPFLPLTGFFYIIFFALPPFVISREWWSNGGTIEEPSGIFFETITSKTALLVLIGLLMLAAGYYAGRPLVRRAPRYRLPVAVSWPRLRILLWLCAAMHLTYLYLPAARAMSPVGQAMAPIGLFAIGLLFVAWYRGQLRDVEKIIYWAVLIPFEFLIHVYEGLITPIILLFLFLITLYWYLSRKIGVILTLVLFAALYIFPILKLSNVFIVQDSPTVASRVSDKMGAIGLAALLFSAQGQEEGSAVAGKNVAPPLLRRLALVVVLQFCVDQTPERVAYLKGETFKNLLTNLVPRVFWPNKPTEVMGQWFGHTYRILHPGDRVTSINLPWIVEFYINFGPLGVAVGMGLVGVLLALLERMLLQPEMSELEIVTGWALIFRLFYQESNLSLMLGGFITQAVFFLGFVWIAIRLFCRPSGTRVSPP